MDTNKLVISEIADGGWCIAWYLSDDGDLGIILGEDMSTDYDLKHLMATTNDWFEVEESVAELTARSLTTEYVRGKFIVWDTKRQASSVLKKINATIRAEKKDFEAKKNKQAPLQEWEKTALSNGWKPPKGWRQ